MTQLVPDDQVLAAARAAGFTGEGLRLALAVALAEAGVGKTVIDKRVDARASFSDPKIQQGTDRGAWEINSHWHPEVSDVCAYDLRCAARETYRISKGGTDWSPWSTYQAGRHEPFLARAAEAVTGTDPRVLAMQGQIAAGTPGPHTHTAMAGITAVTLRHPFADATYSISQAYANTTYSGEPPGYLFPDRSIGYVSGPGAVWHPYLHNGEDFPWDCGHWLIACADGVVTYAGHDDTGFGLCLQISHGPVRTLYAHLHEILVKVGQAVIGGQRVAVSGGDAAHPYNSGNSTGCHLHWSVLSNASGRFLDPAPLLVGSPSAPAKPPRPSAYKRAVFSVRPQRDAYRVHLFLGPQRGSPQLAQLSPDQLLPCVGYVKVSAEDAVYDRTTGKDDPYWYAVNDGHSLRGWVPSGRVLGNAPGVKP